MRGDRLACQGTGGLERLTDGGSRTHQEKFNHVSDARPGK
jgi:hypothetical protein